VVAPIEIADGLLHAVYAEARGAFPAECCGWLAGAPAEPTRVTELRPCTNRHDPAIAGTLAGRGAETAYRIDGDDLRALGEATSRKAASYARVIYHSHPNGKAYFSPADRAEATYTDPVDGSRGPMWGKMQFLVVGLDGARVVEAAMFAWSDGDGEFIEIARYPGAAL
jgi:[CysO sulfur-carrier protein]-S-L-cysteine hydrolase